MGTFHVHESHDVERLAARLAGLFDEPRGGPFDPEAVVVPGRGMSVWLSMELSRTLGVWALPFSYPRQLVERVVRVSLGGEALGPEPLSESLLEWAVRATLPTLLDQPEFSQIRRYLEGDEHGVRLGELSARVATVFDQYLTYRPHWVRAWHGGGVASAPGDERWQALLFQRVLKRVRAKHVAHVEEALLARLAEARPIAGLPPRVSLFGLSTLPPLYVRVLALLSRHVDVHLFRFAPGPRGEGRSVRPGPLEALGTTGDELSTVLRDTLEHHGIRPTFHADFARGASVTLLDSLKARLGDPLAPAPDAAPLDAPSAPSIVVHSCHGPLREVEVLHDQLLSLLTRKDDPVSPDDVAVLVPAIEEYAPLIEAVFRRDPADPRYVPFSVADRSARRTSPGFDAFLRVLDLVRGRVTAADIADLFGVDTVLARLGLDATSADRIKEWIVESGIRWGIDRAHLESLGLPGEGGQTWEFGLRRLMLGFAMPSGGRRTFSGVLGYDEVEGKDGELLGVLASFVRRLFERLRDFERPRSLPDWTVALGELARELFAEDEAGSREIAAIQKALDALVRFAGTAGFSGDLAIASVRRLLEQKADSLSAERGFLSGGVTFSAMVPMRSIPFRVVALLGMSDGAFPRSPRPVEFDLMQTAREVGDRSPRDDDRQLFLETLFAARERLVVTYSGRSVRDDRPIPPSTCLAELLEALVGPTGAEAAKRRAALVVEHRLQGYSPAYFDGQDPRLFSYQREYESAATSVGESREARPFVRELEPVVPPASIALADLLKFFKCPPAYLLNQRLGIYLKERRPEIMTRELLQVTSLEDWQMATPLIAAFLEDDDAERAVATVETRLRAEGRLPIGGWGQAVLKQRAELCQAIAVEAKSRRGSADASVVEVDVALDGLPRISGSVRDYYAGAIVECGYSALGARYQLDLWIRHLALCAGGRSPVKGSVRVARDAKSRSDKRKVAVVEFEPLAPEAARAELESLVRLFLEGQSRPVPFMPKESFSYVERLKEKKNARDALGTAVAAYDGSDMSTSSFDPHPQRAFDYLMPPFDARYDRGEIALEKTDFHVLAHRVLGPLFAAKVEGSA